MTPYKPIPGTIAYRALGWFQAEPRGDVTMSLICDALDMPPQNAKQSVDTLVTHGYLERFQKHGLERPQWYRLRIDEPAGLHIEAALAPRAATDSEQDTREDGKAAHPSVSANQRQGNGHAERRPNPAVHASNGKAKAEAPRCALWSDGTLIVERASGQTLRFEADEAGPIVRYLRRAWLEGAS